MWIQRFSRAIKLTVCAFCLISLVFGLNIQPTYAQDTQPCPGFTAEDQSDIYHEIDFGESLRFHLCWHNMPEVESASILIEIETFSTPFDGTAPAPTDADTGDLINLNHELNLAQTLIPPFSEVSYEWTINYQSGDSEVFPQKTFVYSDNRVKWQEIGEENLRVHSTAEHEPIAKIALGVIERTLPKIEAVIPLANDAVEQNTPIDVYLYPDSQTFQSALRLTGLDWVAGKASPEIGVIMIPITSGSDEAAAQADLEQRLPHELSHMLVYRATGDGYRNLPSWFDEGVATSFETVPNPNYAFSIANVTDSTQLIPFSELCVNLPIQPPEMALRGYAQSHALIGYIKAKYGSEAIQETIKAAAAGAHCDEAIVQGVGKSTDELAQEWLNGRQPDPLEPGSPLRVGLFLFLGLFVLIAVILWTRTYGTRTISEFNG